MIRVNKLLTHITIPFMGLVCITNSYASWDCDNAYVEVINNIFISYTDGSGSPYTSVVTWSQGNSNNFADQGNGVPFGDPITNGQMYSLVPMGTEGSPWNMSSFEHPNITVEFADDPPAGYQKTVCNVINSNEVGFALQGGSGGGNCNLETYPAFGFTFEPLNGNSGKGNFGFQVNLNGTFEAIQTGVTIPECSEL